MSKQLIGAGLVATLLAVVFLWDSDDSSPPARDAAEPVAESVAAAARSPSPDLENADALPVPASEPQVLPAAVSMATPNDGVSLATVGDPVRWTGSVTDPDGNPLPDVNAWLLPTGVTLVAAGYALERIQPSGGMRISPSVPIDAVPLADLPHSRTDADGRFTLDGRHLHSAPTAQEAFIQGFYAPREPLLLLAAPGMTTRVVSCEERPQGVIELGSFMLEPEARLLGVVVNAEGEPVADATVGLTGAAIEPKRAVNVRGFITDLHAELHSTRTDAHGRFELSGLWCGGVTVTATAAGYLPAEQRTLLPEPGRVTSEDLVLQRGVHLAGRVTDTEGAAISGAEVIATSRPITSAGHGDIRVSIPEDADRVPLEHVLASRSPAGRAHTDANGQFLIDGLDGVNFTLYIAARGYEVARVSDVPADSNERQIPLSSESTLRVTLLDAATGAVLTDPSGEAERMSGSRGARIMLEVEADSEGLLVHRVGPKGTNLVVWAPGFARRAISAPGVSAADGHAEFSVELQPEAVLVGRILSSAGDALPGARVELRAQSAPPEAPPQALASDAHGAFQFTNLSDDTLYDLRATKLNYAVTRLNDLTPQAADDVPEQHELVLARGAVLSGTAYDFFGNEAMYTQLSLARAPFDQRRTREERSDWDSWMMTGESGQYSFVDLPPGRYRLSPENLDPIELDLAEGQREVLDLHHHREPVVTGRVTVNDQPLAGALVQAQPGRGLHLAPRDPVTTNEHGEYRMPLPTAGEFVIQVMRRAQWELEALAGSVTVTLAWGEERSVDLEVPGGRIAGRSVNAVGGGARPGIELSIEQWLEADEDWEFFSSATTDDEGAFAFEGLAPGSYRVTTESYAYTWQHIRVREGPLELGDGESIEVTLEIDRGAVLSGEVRNASGVLVPDGASVKVFREGKARASYVSFVNDGRYVLAGLRAGTYRLAAFKDYEAFVDQPDVGTLITIAAREERTIDLVTTN